MNKKEYLSDEELKQFIAEIEAKPLLHPPRELKNDILQTLHQKKKRRKNAQLFFYGMKVAAATAAALFILLNVPNNLYSQEKIVVQQEETFEGDVLYRFNQRINGYFVKLNNKLNQLMKVEVIHYEKEKE